MGPVMDQTLESKLGAHAGNSLPNDGAFVYSAGVRGVINTVKRSFPVWGLIKSVLLSHSTGGHTGGHAGGHTLTRWWLLDIKL